MRIVFVLAKWSKQRATSETILMPAADQEEEDRRAMEMTRCQGRRKSARWDVKGVIEYKEGLVLNCSAAEVAQCFEMPGFSRVKIIVMLVR